jgi:hypothetical protein
MDGFTMRGVSRAGFLRTFHGARPYTVDGSLVVLFTNPKLELLDILTITTTNVLTKLLVKQYVQTNVIKKVPKVLAN